MNYFVVFGVGLTFILAALVGVGMMVGIPGQWIAIAYLGIVGVAIVVGATKFHKHSRRTNRV